MRLCLSRAGAKERRLPLSPVDMLSSAGCKVIHFSLVQDNCLAASTNPFPQRSHRHSIQTAAGATQPAQPLRLLPGPAQAAGRCPATFVSQRKWNPAMVAWVRSTPMCFVVTRT